MHRQHRRVPGLSGEGNGVMSHTTKIERSGGGLIASCSCRQRTTQPVESRQAAEDWIHKHEQEVRKAQAGQRPLSDRLYLEHLRTQERDAPTAAEKRLWKQLADEFEPRVRTKGTTEQDIPLL